eukprot:11068588-Prorocentrum_lima.AAC.1
MLPKEDPVRTAGRMRPITLLCGMDKVWHKAFLARTPALGGEADLTMGFVPGRRAQEMQGLLFLL